MHDLALEENTPRTPPEIDALVWVPDVLSEELPGESQNYSDLHSRARKGIQMLLGREVLLQIFTFGGNIYLARLLTPALFGLYTVATVLVSMFAVLGDFGLAPSLIQRKDELATRDMQVAFTLQQVLTSLIVITLFIAAPYLARLYPKTDPNATTWLVRTLAFGLYLTSWRTISALQLERKLKYDKLARVEVIEVLAYQILSIALARMGYGVWSFVWAALARGMLGAGLIYAAEPWRVRFAMDKQSAFSILRYGVPFQFQALANQAGNWLSPILVGSVVGPAGVGFLTWASSNGKKPIILVDNIMRVSFPHFARIQHDTEEVERILVRYLTYMVALCGAWFIAIATAGEPLVRVLYTDKWTPAVGALVLCAFTLPFDVTALMGCVTLNAVGKVKFATNALIVRTVIYIVLIIALVHPLGFIAVPLAFLIASALTIPFLLDGLGPGVSKRVFLQLSWLIIPSILGVVAGRAALVLLQRLGVQGVMPIAGQNSLHPSILSVASPGAFAGIVSFLSALSVSLALAGFSVVVYMLVIWMTAPSWLRNIVRARLAKLSLSRKGH